MGNQEELKLYRVSSVAKNTLLIDANLFMRKLHLMDETLNDNQMKELLLALGHIEENIMTLPKY